MKIEVCNDKAQFDVRRVGVTWELTLLRQLLVQCEKWVSSKNKANMVKATPTGHTLNQLF